MYKKASKTLRQLILIAIFVIQANYANAAFQVAAEESIFTNIGIIAKDNIDAVITNSLKEGGIDNKISVNIKGYKKGIVISEKHNLYDVNVVKFSSNKKSRRFKATIAFSQNGFSELIKIDGNYKELVEIPVLKYRLAYGSTISPSDIEFMEIAKHKIRYDTIQNERQLIGKSLKHSMSKMRQIRKRDIVKKNLVSRSNIVKIFYKAGILTLQTTGIALDNGAKGDLIRVRNNKSKNIITAVVKSENMVIVSPETL